MRSSVFSSSIILLPFFCLTDATFLHLLGALGNKVRNTNSGISRTFRTSRVSNDHIFGSDSEALPAFRDVSSSSHITQNDEGANEPLEWQPNISFESVRDNRNTNDFAVQIVREEAPLIRQIEIQINEGLEAERNLTAVRAAIRRELAEAKRSGSLGGGDQLFRMERQLQQLDGRLAGLHAKNQEAEKRFRNFVGGIDSGRIRTRRQARLELGGIAQFCSQVVMHYVKACVSLCAGIVNFYKNIFVGIANVFRGILGLKLRSVQAGVNMVAGI